MANTYYSAQGDTLDIICHYYYGAQSNVLEVLIDANKHLAQLALVLPIGTKIILPEIEAPSTNKRVALW